MNLKNLSTTTNNENENLISGYNNSSKFINALQVYLINECREYYVHNNLEKIFIKAQDDHDLQARLLKSVNKFIVM